ncbi:general odorant-binding protein 67-like [Ochlerotatus camptorhynchus]|uniref:general odorant-binding protein 67-like n=1 Tax=Ochlerotatus camptorhynchus TaxID=644619 RepID=UPI0031DEEAB1
MKFNLVLLTGIGLVATVCSQQQINPECFNRPNNKHLKECCATPNFIPTREEFTTCMQRFPKPDLPPTPGSSPPVFNCMAQCMLEELGIMTNDVLSKDAATSKLVSLVGSSSDWQTVAKTSVDTCYQKVAATLSEKNSLGCSVAAGTFFDCLPTTMFTDCPTSAWTPSDECNQLKVHLLNGCPIMTLMKGPNMP